MLTRGADELLQARTPTARQQAMIHLRAALANGNHEDLVAAIRRVMEMKADAATGEGFRPGKDGFLAEAPTLRTFLMDQLARLDPAAVSEMARSVLNTSESPDDWALALRDLARHDTSADTRALVEKKTAELLRNEQWQQAPSAGYLEAFDIAVYLGGTNLLSPLTELVSKKDNPAVAHAAFLTLDRLVINQPRETLSVLSQHPEWMQGRPETRANYFARADVSDAIQRQLVEEYLLSPARTPQELTAFCGVFPNANFMISQNLLTQNATPDAVKLRQLDMASLKVVNEWLRDPRFQELQPQLTTIKRRLEEFTK